jgi:hypothetical protein
LATNKINFKNTDSLYVAYQPAAPCFNWVRGARGQRVDGEHFFDIVAENIVYEVL